MPPSTLISMIHASPTVGFQVSPSSPPSCSPSLSACRLSPSLFPSYSARPRSSDFSLNLTLSVSLERPRVTVRPRRWTGEDWRFAIAATCSTASKAPKVSHGVPTATDFPPGGREHLSQPIGARPSPRPPMGPSRARAFRQSCSCRSQETGWPGTTHRSPTVRDQGLLHSLPGLPFLVLCPGEAPAENRSPAAQRAAPIFA